MSFIQRREQQWGASRGHQHLGQRALPVLDWLDWVFMDSLFSNFLGILSIKEVLVEFFCILVNFSQSRLHLHSWPLEEVGNNSCFVHFRPDSSAPKSLHLRPYTIGDFLTWSLSKMLLKGGLNIVDFLRACSSKTQSKPENNIMTCKQI